MIKNCNQVNSYFSTNIQMTPPSGERTERKKWSFYEAFNNSLYFRKKDSIVNNDNKEDKRRISTSYKSIKYYKQKTAAYRFLHKPTNLLGRAYHMIISTLILICIVMTILSTFNQISLILNEALYGMDIIILVFLVIEFGVRLWASECISHYRGWRGKVRFFLRPFRIIDLIVIITSIFIVVFSVNNKDFIVPSLQWIRFFQTFKMVRIEHRFRPWRVMASVIWSQRQHLYITIYSSFLVLLLTAFLMYFVEKDSNPAFDNMGESLWWTVVTLCTIGYGDIFPITTAGKIIASLAAIIGISLFALPAGILGTGLALKVNEQHRYKKIGKRRMPAAQLIQSRWRLHHFLKNPNVSPFNALNQTATHQQINRVLTPTERNCLMFILKIKYFRSRHRFGQTCKPYDLKDVLEQYSVGHLEMLSRVKHINHKIHSVEVISESGLKGQHELKGLVNYRITKLEEFMTETDSKLNQLLKIQNKNTILFENILSVFEPNSSPDWTRI